jgi:hypothetical protein
MNKQDARDQILNAALSLFDQKVAKLSPGAGWMQKINDFRWF